MQTEPIKGYAQGSINSFSSYQEFVKTALGPSQMADGARQSIANSNAFAGISWKDAQQLAPLGDIKKAQELKALNVRAANRVILKQTRLDPLYVEADGVWIDTARYLSGSPECWGDMRAQGAVKTVRGLSIVFCASGHSGINISEFEKVGVSIAGALMGLRASGVPVKLQVVYAHDGYDYPKSRDITTIDLTGTSGSFDCSELAAICSNWFFRRIWFAYAESRDSKYRTAFKTGAFYGRPYDIRMEEACQITGDSKMFKTCILNLRELVYKTSEDIEGLILKELE